MSCCQEMMFKIHLQQLLHARLIVKVGRAFDCGKMVPGDSIVSGMVSKV